MIWDVKLYVGGKVFTESVHAVNRNDAIDTAKNRNPHAKIIGVNPTTRDTIWLLSYYDHNYYFIRTYYKTCKSR